MKIYSSYQFNINTNLHILSNMSPVLLYSTVLLYKSGCDFQAHMKGDSQENTISFSNNGKV